MRFEDWDVLIFPGTGPEAHIPIQEFGVECYGVTDNRLLKDETITAPLMTCFIPSLRAGEPFQISLHSWKPRPFNFRPAGEPHPDRPQVWQFKITVDGNVMCVDTMTADVQWPKAIHVATAQAGRAGRPDHLRFPPFYQESVYAHQWHPYADKGRIKVEISEGFLERHDEHAKFVKLTVHVIFNFQHAPIDVLRNCGKAWPSEDMINAKRVLAPHLMPDMPNDFHTAEFQEPDRFRHHSSITGSKKSQKRRASAYSTFMSSSPMFSNAPGAPPPTPTYGTSNYPVRHPQDGNSSRSTSAYSTLSRSAMPLSVGNGIMHFATAPPFPQPYPGSQPGAKQNGNTVFDSGLEVHIPTDQLQKVVDLLERRANGSVMAPPPLPAHIMDAKSDVEKLEEAAAATEHHVHGDENMIDRRGTTRSSFSDVSMHAGCADFPRCTTEDEDSRIVHQPGSGVVPAAVIRSRKEGSIDHADRAFVSPIANASETAPDEMQTEQSEENDHRTVSSGSTNSTGKKRTRASLKTLSVKETGSPEKRDREMDVDVKPGRKLRKRVTAGEDEDA
ncbi:hypothetical protein CERZMDRAFT_102595 [Cercospora zeae-maydis SCOH1-5]|uniref:Uncharacterized protein n=1 Tax=Cercospora zeae-maydis SCOH1-5 TaxID=717836 RepID=A0A6A6EYJ7_9PEZI|nr:hypothetical protein CERZMDRAFT_102595 [Cercospora zeae-maydis SCOH1-5]